MLRRRCPASTLLRPCPTPARGAVHPITVTLHIDDTGDRPATETTDEIEITSEVRRAGAPETEIEITPAMIKAGVEAFYGYDIHDM